MTPLSCEVSDTIRLARITSIFFTAYIHAWPGAGQVRADARMVGMDWISVIFIDWLGRGAVPLLSIVSGMLVWHTLAARRPQRFLLGKLRTLVVPMVIWNTAMLVLLTAAVVLGLKEHLPDTAWYNWLFALTAEPVNIPLGFLRDVFVCMLLAPVLHPILRHAPMAGLLLAAAIAVGGYVAHDMGWPLFLRPSIFVMFALGLLLVRFDQVAAFSRPALGLAALAGLVLTDLVAPDVFHALGPDLLNLVRRLLIALLVWQACMVAIRYGGHRLLWLERYIFFFFCTHSILFTVLGSISQHVLTDPYSPLYWLYFVVQPILGLVLVALIYNAAQVRVPRFLAVATGQRS